MRTSIAFAAAMAFALASGAQAAMTISNAKTKNVSCASGVCTPTAGNANLNTGELQAMLASADITVKSNAAAPDIGIADPLTWASSHRLTLDSYESIHVRVPVAVEGTSGLTIITNDGGSGGDYTFNTATSGAITFWDTASSLVINGKSYVLVSSIKTLASDIAANPSRNYALAKNYDASVDGVYTNAPVVTAFGGAFEGLGNTIQNLTITSDKPDRMIGLFSVLNKGGTIRDLGLPNAAVSGLGSTCKHCWDEYVGILVAQNFGTITSTSASGSISEGAGQTILGGIAGYSGGRIGLASFTGTIRVSNHHPSAHAGGIAGELTGTILQSSATIDSQGADLAGGLVGYLLDGTITMSHASGTVSGRQAGGLVGVGDSETGATITQSFASTTVFAADEGGGLIAAGNVIHIAQSYSIGAVGVWRDKGNHLGGFMGINVAATISQAYAAGLVTAGRSVPCVAGFVGYDQNGVYASAYWNITSTGQNFSGCNYNVDGITGLTDAQLKSGLPAGFDPNVWGQNASINNGWPYLLANPPQ